MRGTQLIVGASGFIGNKLYSYLKGKGLDVKGTYYFHTFEGAEKDGIYLDLGNPDFSPILDLKNLSHIFLCHGITDIDQCKINRKFAYKINVANAISLLGEFVHSDVVPIYLSTDMVYDGTKQNLKEFDIMAPITEYGKQKLAVEVYIKAKFKKYIILRLTKVFGVERGDGTLFTAWLDSLMGHEVILCADDVFISPVYVMDVVQALDDLVVGEHYGVFNFGGLQIATRYELAQRFARYFKCNMALVERKSIGDFKFVEPRPLYSSLDSSKIMELLGLKQMPFEECFKLIEQNYGGVH